MASSFYKFACLETVHQLYSHSSVLFYHQGKFQSNLSTTGNTNITTNLVQVNSPSNQNQSQHFDSNIDSEKEFPADYMLG